MQKRNWGPNESNEFWWDFGDFFRRWIFWYGGALSFCLKCLAWRINFMVQLYHRHFYIRRGSWMTITLNADWHCWWFRNLVNNGAYLPYQHSERRIFEPSFQQEQKSMLSEQCVQVLITASFQPLLRRHLRGEADGHNLIQLDDGSFQN